MLYSEPKEWKEISYSLGSYHDYHQVWLSEISPEYDILAKKCTVAIDMKRDFEKNPDAVDHQLLCSER